VRNAVGREILELRNLQELEELAMHNDGKFSIDTACSTLREIAQLESLRKNVPCLSKALDALQKALKLRYDSTIKESMSTIENLKKENSFL
jgi:CO/xanthine dehydrogenase FAD-binding subunit